MESIGSGWLDDRLTGVYPRVCFFGDCPLPLILPMLSGADPPYVADRSWGPRLLQGHEKDHDGTSIRPLGHPM